MKFSTKGMVIVVLVVVCLFLLALAERLTKPIANTWKRSHAYEVEAPVKQETAHTLMVAPPPGIPRSKDGLVPPPPPVIP